MEAALHTIKKNEFPGFEVITSLFSHYMETRVFADGENIPLIIVERIKELHKHVDCIADAHVVAEAEWDYIAETRSDTEFTGIFVDTTAFQDAGYIHESVVRIIENFIATHKRVVTYIPK